MKITLWISEETLKQINSGEPIAGEIYMREPGEHVEVLQVQVSEDEYYEILDKQTTDGDIMKEMWECSLPEGAEWDVEYSLEQEYKQDEKWFGPNDRMRDLTHYKQTPSFQDIYDITRSTPNNMELGAKIRQLVNESDE